MKREIEKLVYGTMDQRAALLDIRCAEAFSGGHLPGSVSVPLRDHGDLYLQKKLHAIFLPPRHRALVVIDDDSHRLQAVVRFLEQRGRNHVHALRMTADMAGLVIGPSREHLWQPPAYLMKHLDKLPPPSAGPVVDLGAGSGRAAVWLAEQGYDVTAVDHLPDALELAQALADDRGARITILKRDLTDPKQLPAGEWSVALVFRFLDRDLLRALPSVLRPRAVVIVSTFRWDPHAEILPKRKHCLEAGELLELFPESVFEILDHAEGEDENGRPSAGIVARLRVD